MRCVCVCARMHTQTSVNNFVVLPQVLQSMQHLGSRGAGNWEYTLWTCEH